jgi:hypothetical protein
LALFHENDKKMNEKTAIDFKLTAKGQASFMLKNFRATGNCPAKIPLTILGTANHKT